MPSRDPNFNDMQPNYWSGKIKKKSHSDGSAIYPSLHNRYIAYVYPKYCNYKLASLKKKPGGFFKKEAR